MDHLRPPLRLGTRATTDERLGRLRYIFFHLLPMLTFEIGLGVIRAAAHRFRPASVHPAAPLPLATAAPPMLVLRLVLGLAALGLLHSALFTSVPEGARSRARRDRR